MSDQQEWRMWICSDCGEGEFDEAQSFKIAHQVPAGESHGAGCKVEFCPECGSHLSFTPWGKVTVTNEYGRPQ